MGEVSLAGRGAARHQEFAVISDALTQHRRLQARHDSGFGIIVEREDRDDGLADRKGGCGDDRRDQSLKPLAGLGQLRRNTRVARMNVDADMVGDQTDDALAVRRRQSFARVGQAFTEPIDPKASVRSEEHTSELQSLMRISYAVFCLKKKNTNNTN